MPIFELSAHDKSRLPAKWGYLHQDHKQTVIDFLNSGSDAYPPIFWMKMTPEERRQVIKHLDAGRKIPGYTNRKYERPRTLIEAMMETNQIMKDIPFTRDLPIPPLPTRLAFGGMLYERPNGGKRMLPSLYGRLKDYWLRASGVAVNFADMNNGHLENTLNLLKESHCNVQARAQDLIGRMRHHYQNQPAIVEQIEKLHKMMDEVGVEEMYPIFEPLAEELVKRLPPGYHVVMDLETEPLCSINDDLGGKW